MSIRFDEKDIEDWLYDNPNSINIYGNWSVSEWIGRQYRVPSGIIDLLGVTHTKYGNTQPVFFVVEVKNVPVTSDALTQVCRYSNDIRMSLLRIRLDIDPTIFKVIVAPIENLSSKIMFEAEALKVFILSIKPNIELKVSGEFKWTENKQNQLYSQYDLLSKDFEKYYALDVFEEFISTIPDPDSKEE